MKLKRKIILILMIIIVMFNTGPYSFGMDIPTQLETSEPTTDEIIDIPSKLENPKSDATIDIPTKLETTETGVTESEDTTGLQKEETSEQQTVQDNLGIVDKEDTDGFFDGEEGGYLEAIDDGLQSVVDKTEEIVEQVEHGGGGHRREPEQEDNAGSSVIDFDYQGYQPADQQGYDKAVDWAGSILGTLRNIGVIVAIIALMIIGVKYMVGSVEQKAQYKQTLVPLAIGIIMLVAGTVLISLIYEIFV